jgi:OmpA-OmpF porin, OOP family
VQGGYNWDLHVVVGVGAYFDWNNYTFHSNGVGYASRAYGLDAELGLPVDDWLPYIKWGYGRNMATGNTDLSAVVQYGSNIAVGAEYNFAPRWSAITEYKMDRFSNRDGSITINNKIFSFGFNYYFDRPLKAKEVEMDAGPDLPIPEPTLQPDAVPIAPPAP